MELPRSVQDIVNIIGREDTMFLISQLPSVHAGARGKKSRRVVLSVPRNMSMRHKLVGWIGFPKALALANAIGGASIQLAVCRDLVTAFHAREAVRLRQGGMSVQEIAELIGVSKRTVWLWMKNHQYQQP